MKADGAEGPQGVSRYLVPMAVWLLSLTDALLTVQLVRLGADEVNPLANSILGAGERALVIWKVCWVGALCLVLMAIWPHHPRLAFGGTAALCVLYYGLVMYEVGLWAAL